MQAEPLDAVSAAAPDLRRKKRRPPIAFLLSLLCPGLGQLYATRIARGAWLLGIAVLAAAVVLGTLMLPPSRPLLLIGFASATLLLVYQLVTAIDAALVARRAGRAPLTRANRVWIYLVVLLAWMVLPGQFLEPLLRWKSYNIPAASMQPTLMVGDYLVAWRGYFADHPPQPGDLAVFKLPRDNTTDFVKRIVGLPGQRLQMRGGRLYIDDVPVARAHQYHLPAEPALDRRTPVIEYVETLPNGVSYRIHEVSDTGMLDDTPVFTVPPGHVFVLGDNRDNSIDSRMAPDARGVGFVPVANLRDRPSVIFWARDRGRLGLTPR